MVRRGRNRTLSGLRSGGGWRLPPPSAPAFYTDAALLATLTLAASLAI